MRDKAITQNQGRTDYQKHIFNVFIQLIIIASLSIIIYAYAGAYSTVSPVYCIANCSNGTLNGGYELFNHTTQYCDLNPIECFNTIDDCKDGSLTISSVRQGSPYEWVHNITLVNLNASNFSGGDLIQVNASFKCDYNDDEVAFAYNNGSGWRNFFNKSCIEDFNDDFSVNIELDEVLGNHTIRAIVAYDGYAGMTCGYDADNLYSDTDDISFFVFSQYEINPPRVNIVQPKPGTSYEYILPKTFNIEAEVTDDTGIQYVKANVTWGVSSELVSLEQYNSTFWMGEFVNANQTGAFNITLIAQDTNGNINSSEKTYFYLIKTTNITINNPTNEKWVADYSINLDFDIGVKASVFSAGFIINDGLLNSTTTPISHSNQLSNINETYVNNSQINNISQSFNLSENLTIGIIMLKLKRIGNGQDLNITIKNDSGGSPGPSIASANTTNTISNTTFSWINFSFQDFPALVASKKYWICITPQDNSSDNILFAVNNDSYARGQLSSNTSLDLLFRISDEFHFNQNITLTQDINNITVYANVSGVSNLIKSPTIDIYVDRSGPDYDEIVYSPKNPSGIDPGKPINISVNITDHFNVSSAILQYKPQNSSIWANATMLNASDTFYGNFTPTFSGNWSIRIFSNDTLSNIGYSVLTNISVTYEKSYSLNLTYFNLTLGVALNTNGSMGSIGILNTGDLNLTFKINKSDTKEPLIFFDNNCNVTNLNVAPNSIKFFNVTVTSPNYKDNLPITILITPINETMGGSTVNATLATCLPGPCFIIDLYSDNPSSLPGESITINEITIENVGDQNALNVTLMWSLPGGVELSNENITKNIGDINTGRVNRYIDRSTLNVLATASSGQKTVSIQAINNLTNNTGDLLITILSNIQSPGGGTKDKGQGPSTTYYVPSFIEVGKPVIKIEAPETLEIPRGGEITFYANITNLEEKNISNITIILDGFILSYTHIIPDFLSLIEKNSTSTVNISLDAPLYLNEGKYPLKITANFLWREKKVTYEKEITLIIASLNYSDFAECLTNAEKDVNILADEGYSTELLFSKLLESRRLLLLKDYEESLNLCNELAVQTKNARESKRLIDSLMESRNIGLYSKSLNDALMLAVDALNRGEFTMAKQRAEDATILLKLEESTIKNKLKRSALFIKENLGYFLIAILIGGVLSYIFYSRLSLRYLNKKVASLNEEEASILQLIGKAQKHRYKEKAISGRVYEKHMGVYRSRISKIQEEKNSLRLKILALKGSSKIMGLQSQIELLTYLKKELQTKFYIKKIIDEKSYYQMSLEYNNMLSDLSEQLEMFKDMKEKQKNDR